MIKTFYARLCKVEESLTKFFLVVVFTLVFFSALFRTFGIPINWAVDVAKLFFSWAVFFGTDMAIRENRLVRVDMLTDRLPNKITKTIEVLFSLVILAFLIVMIKYGVTLCVDNEKRQFANMAISYSWATLSLPVGCFFMVISQSIRLKSQIKEALLCYLS